LCTLYGVLEQDSLYAQTTIRLSGQITHAVDNTPLSGATVRVTGPESRGEITNKNGFYSFDLPEGKYRVEVSYIGFKKRKDTFELKHSLVLNIQLTSRRVLQQELVVTDHSKDENLKNTEMGTVQLSLKEIEKLPSIFGETDILKTLQMLPGVNSGGEGTTDLLVRGGGPGQNLVLLDGAPIYNTGHLFGFFSVFNGDAIKDLTLIKDGMPANYGGRLSSVLDIRTKNGNRESLHGSGGVGLVASHFSLEGPVVKDKSSFFIAGRRTYIDALVRPFVSKSSSFSGSGYYFYDLNFKWDYRISDKDYLFFSGYLGQDHFKYVSDNRDFNMEMPWGNKAFTLGWKHTWSDKLFMNTTLIYNDYSFKMKGRQRNLFMGMNSGIDGKTAKIDFSYYLNDKHHLKFGSIYTTHQFIPSLVSGSSDKVVFDADNPLKKYGREGALYVLDQWEVSPRIKVNAGVRYSFFQQQGPFKAYKKNNKGEIIDSTFYSDGETVVTYSGWEPRFILRYLVNEHSAIKASITKNYQYIHLVNSNSTTLPTDLWVPSTAMVKPGIAWQYALGYYRDFKEHVYEGSFSVYYKALKNQIEFSDGYVPQLGEPQNSFVFGSGQAYGTEFFLRKNTGRLKGWIGYSLSWVNRKFSDLNDGKQFPARQDRRHNLKVVASYKLNNSWTLAANFVLQSGHPITLPEQFYLMEGTLSQQYVHLNSYRLPTYHRLDLSATYRPEPKPNRKFSHTWTFSVYNVYSRLNPFFIYIDIKGNYQSSALDVQPRKVALFPIIPSVSWNFEF